MNDWGIPDWRDPAAYGDISTWTFERWRWEFMRRQPDLRAYFDERAEAARKARCDLASNANSYPNFVTEMTCAIDDPRFTLLEDPECKKLFGYLRLHNPRVSKTLPSGFLANENPDAVKIHGQMGDLWIFTQPSQLEQWQTAVTFDLTKPLEKQFEAARDWLTVIYESFSRDNVIARFRVDLWPRYLRFLDAEAAGASLHEMGRTIFPGELGDTKNKAHKTLKEQVQKVVSKLRAYNPPPDQSAPA